MSSSTYILKIRISRIVTLPSAPGEMDRERFIEWIWERFGGPGGLLGVHEGTLLTEEAAQQGLETESWTVDAGLAPRERDWIGAQERVLSELYFETERAARDAMALLGPFSGVHVLGVREQQPEDWDAQWKAAFMGAKEGVLISPFWRILPPWVDDGVSIESPGLGARILRINPGAGFGTGTHETTQLCLRAMASTGRDWKNARVLDFGSGSGILAIGAALLGGRVDAVEIDPLAIDNAIENARLNGVETRIGFSRSIPPEGRYDVVIANILRPVLLENAERLHGALKPRGGLILSGLIEPDVAPVRARYSALRAGAEPQVHELAEWRALVW